MSDDHAIKAGVKRRAPESNGGAEPLFDLLRLYHRARTLISPDTRVRRDEHSLSHKPFAAPVQDHSPHLASPDRLYSCKLPKGTSGIDRWSHARLLRSRP